MFDGRLITSMTGRLRITSLRGTAVKSILLMTSGLRRLANVPFVHVSRNSPKLPTGQVNVRTRGTTLSHNINSRCPTTTNVPRLGCRTSHFIGTFVSVSVSPQTYVPAANSMTTSFNSFVTYARHGPKRGGVLFVSPNFPVRGSRLQVVNTR